MSVLLLVFLPFLHATCSVTELSSLTALYESTSGPNWIDNTYWISNEDCCKWFGASCDSNGTLTGLSLRNNGLVGVIPREIYKLVTLSSLHLEFNSLHGVVPKELGTMENLYILHLGNNNLTGIEIESPDFTLMCNAGCTMNGNSWQGTLPEWARTGACASPPVCRVDKNGMGLLIGACAGLVGLILYAIFSTRSSDSYSYEPLRTTSVKY